ncbi:MAG: ATP-binding protein [Bacillota bacterium]
MSKILNSKLKYKFYGFTATLILSLLFTGVLSVLLMREINTGTTIVSMNWLPSVIIAEELNTATSDFRIAEASHVISQDRETMQQHELTLSDISDEIDLMFAEYTNNLVTNATDRALLEEAKTLWTSYLDIHANMISYSRDNDTTRAMDIMSKESELLFNEVSAVFLELVMFNKNGADQASLEGDHLYSYAIVIVGVIFLISIYIFRKFSSLMSEIETTQEELSNSQEEALLSSQAKSNFLANMSHEIRTPMNAISGMIDIILRETEDEEITEYAQNIKRACDSLLTIINDVLDISKIESGKLEIIETEYSFSSLLNDVLTIATNRLDSKSLMFVTDFQHDLPDKLIGDEVRVKQIMVNLLNNAIKFTQEGHISFHVSGDYTDGNLRLQFSVTDTGIGISEEDIEKLFVEFERVNTTKNRTIEGTGLGLAISKRLCEMMGGQIEVTSTLGVGTTFAITINQKYTKYMPIAKVENSKSILIFESRDLYRNSLEKACNELALDRVVCCVLQSELSESLDEQTFDYVFTSSFYHHKVQEMLLKKNLNSKIVILADNASIKTKYDYATLLMPTHSISIANFLNGKFLNDGSNRTHTNFIAPKCTILIVDDNVVNLKVAQGLMKPYQFSIDTAENGEEAVKAVQKKKYDLVFMDHMMPIMDGIDATIAIRALDEEYYKKLPIVALTANAIIGTEEIFIKEGMNDFLAKPIKLSSLNDVLLKWLPDELQIPIDDTAVAKAMDTTPKISIPSVDTTLGLKRVGGNFSVYLNILEVYYKDGIKCIAKVKAYFDKEDFHNYRVEVHALKSASASIGALDISQKAKLLEDACNTSNWVYVNQNTTEFIDDFNILLENMREALKGYTCEDDTTKKESGSVEFYKENLNKLKEALDNVDINLCDSLLRELFEFNWEESTLLNLAKIKDFLSGYEYDEAMEFIDTLLD